MSKLISANFARLQKDKVFIGGVIFMFMLGIFVIIQDYTRALKFDLNITPDSSFFQYALIIGFLSPAFCSLFTGTEYSDGTIRNKVTAGHTRSSIYLSSLIVNIAASLVMCLIYMIAVSVSGILLLGAFQADAAYMLQTIFGTVLMIITFCAIFTFIAMLNQNKAAVCVICIMGFIVMLMANVYINSRLNEPEVYDSYMYEDADGTVITVGPEPNLNYLKGTKRSVCEFLMDFLPTGQSIQYSQGTPAHPYKMWIYSFCIPIALTGAGVALFRKKNIK